jgi:hypothetical protein
LNCLRACQRSECFISYFPRPRMRRLVVGQTSRSAAPLAEREVGPTRRRLDLRRLIPCRAEYQNATEARLLSLFRICHAPALNRAAGLVRAAHAWEVCRYNVATDCLDRASTCAGRGNRGVRDVSALSDLNIFFWYFDTIAPDLGCGVADTLRVPSAGRWDRAGTRRRPAPAQKFRRGAVRRASRPGHAHRPLRAREDIRHCDGVRRGVAAVDVPSRGA